MSKDEYKVKSTKYDGVGYEIIIKGLLPSLPRPPPKKTPDILIVNLYVPKHHFF